MAAYSTKSSQVNSVGRAVHRFDGTLNITLDRQGFLEGEAGAEKRRMCNIRRHRKLDALQTFVSDLNWPEEEVFRKYLNVRMKTLTSDMISKVASRQVSHLSSYDASHAQFTVLTNNLMSMGFEKRKNGAVKVYSNFELQGIDEEKLNEKMYQAISRRMQLEGTNVALHEESNGHAQSIFPSSLGNATASVSNVPCMVEGSGAKVFSFFK